MKPYDIVLGPALVILGIMLFVGIGTRISLFLQGLLYCSLTFGLILIRQDGGVAWLAAHMILIAYALTLAKHNKLAVMDKY
jgi:thiosulfate dehydrogenase [quinone] large subunit